MHDIAAERCGLLMTYTYSNLIQGFSYDPYEASMSARLIVKVIHQVMLPHKLAAQLTTEK